MPLDPQAKLLIEQMEALGLPPTEERTVEQARELSRQRRLTRPELSEPVARVEDRRIPGPHGEIPVRIYWPEGAGPFPVLVYFHGGGWVICDLDSHDGVCRSLTRRAGCLTASIDYRLAPEHKFPVPAEDCYAATRWVAANVGGLGGDPSRLAVGGDSAGGNLAAVVAQMARDRGGPPLAFQLLVYPVTNHDFETVSYRDNADGYMLTRAAMGWYWSHYLSDPTDGRQPYASPLQASDLGGLPPALVITAEFDPLRDEGEAYGSRLRDAGVAATVHRYDGMIHGFFSMAAMLTQAEAAVNEAASALRMALRR
jgi:acetyl esterase